jgi:hypothetical protein
MVHTQLRVNSLALMITVHGKRAVNACGMSATKVSAPHATGFAFTAD